MMIKYAHKKKQIYCFSLLALAVTSCSCAFAKSSNGDIASNASQLADVKNQISQSTRDIPAQYISLPQTRFNNASMASGAPTASRLNQQVNFSVTTTQRSGGLQVYKNASYSEKKETPVNNNTAANPSSAPAVQDAPMTTNAPDVPKEAVAVAATVATTNSSNPKTPIVIPNTTTQTTASNSTALGSYQLKNKPYFYQCFHKSAAKYKVPVDLLLAIAQTESSFRTHALGKNSTSEDLGVMQINTSWLPKLGREFGLKRHHLYEPCTNIDIGAWVLAHNFVQFGYTWNAVGAYNAKSPEKRVIYVRKVAKNLEKLRRGEL